MVRLNVPGRRRRSEDSTTETDTTTGPVPSPATKPAVSSASSRLTAGKAKAHAALNSVRSGIASVVWLVAALAAIVLVVGALLITLGANNDNLLVGWALDGGRALDGPFWRVFDFYKETKSGAQGPPDQVKNHLVNWGLAAVAYLVAGRVLNRIIRP